MQLNRDNLSQQVADALRVMIVAGRLPDGERINEVRLAKNLGVSRTPLREALGRLTSEGAVTMQPRRGFFVTPLTLEEFEQADKIRPILDPVALRLSGVPSTERLDRLDAINKRLKATSDASVAVAVDDEWHLELLADCPNRILVSLIEQMMSVTRRYELALFRETGNTHRATDEHEKIVQSLRSDDLDQACAFLKRNMESDRELVVSWLVERSAKRELGNENAA